MARGPKTGGLLGDAYQHRAKDILSQRFVVPPFSVLNTREGQWQERKRQWISIGIQSELGRGAALQPAGNDLYQLDKSEYKRGLTYNPGVHGADPMGMRGKYADAKTYNTGGPGTLRKQLKDKEKFAALRSSRADVGARLPTDEDGTGGTSIFDPVLCELVYRWFAPPNAQVLDPFAGGSVRGIVAGELGHHYTGIDLSARQLAANRAQALQIGTTPTPLWIEGDSFTLPWPKQVGSAFDLLFTCPPYGNLEVYSDDARDLSVMSDDAFDDHYLCIILRACKHLAEHAFAVFVVGDYRDKDGFYRNLPGKTIDAFHVAGLELYNSCILVNSAGSLPLRINQQFSASRKLGTTHQTVLVFCKGQPKTFVKGWPKL